MKLFGWMQSKLKHGRHDENSQKPNSKPVIQAAVAEPGIEEVNDWLHGLLTIGTFGKNDLKEDLQKANVDGDSPSSSEDQVQDPVSDENLQDEMNSLLHEQYDHDLFSAIGAEQVQLYRQLSIEAERYTSNDAQCCDESSNRSDSLQHGMSLVMSRGKDVSIDSAKNAVGKKSFSFLVKKIFLCRSGFPSGPSPKSTIHESRMEKMLRTILHKKIYPQSSSPSLSAKKYFENGNMLSSINEDDITENKADKGSKWVRTDSEYIVLEI